MRCALLLLALGACNDAFGITHVGPDAHADDATFDVPIAPPPDLDLDGIPDATDPCIAAMIDAQLDPDTDGVLNQDDHCPLNGAAAPTDADGDGLADGCDPDNGPPNAMRCVMAFGDITVNAALWQPRPSFTAFSNEPKKLHCNATDMCAAVAAEPVTTPLPLAYYDVRFSSALATSTIGAIAVWPRMGASDADAVGCIFYRDTGGFHYAVSRGGTSLATHPYTGATTGILMMRASITSDAQPTVTCNASFSGVFDPAGPISAVIPEGATGQLGFSSTGWDTAIVGVVIDD